VAATGLEFLTPEKTAELRSYAPNAAAQPKQQAKVNEPLFVSMDTIKAEKVDLLWPNRIPIGRMTLFDGDPGAGKSFLSLAVASAVSLGGALPGISKLRAASNVLLLSVEDGFSDTVRPRLDLMGADVSKIYIPNPKRGLAPSLLNASFIESTVKQIGPLLVVIDPIVAFSTKTNKNQNHEVRELLNQLLTIAEKYSLACILVRHLNKQGSTKAMYRGSGSIDFMAASRSAFVAEDGEDKGRRIFAHVKNSLGPKQRSLSFYIDDGRFRWGEEVDSDADDLLQPSHTQGRQKHQLEAGKGFLEDALANGPVRSNDVKAKAKEAGISNATLWRAKELLPIKASKELGSGEWFWRLA
jgi:RecA-family ATPase